MSPHAKYLELTRQLVESLDDYPKNQYGGFNHFADTENVMYLGDAYMACPTCARYAYLTGQTKYCDMAIEQILLMWRKMRSGNGLLRHGWDCSKQAKWADKSTGLSPVVWGRALGFFIAAVVDVAEYVDVEHPQYESIISIISEIISVVAEHQSKNGGWYQIVDKPDQDGNWIEFSGTCLLLYSMAKAYRLQYIDKKYFKNIAEGYKGIIDSIDFSKEGYLLMRNISPSVKLGGVEEYLKQRTNLNDLHGAGSFALMCSEMSQIEL